MRYDPKMLRKRPAIQFDGIAAEHLYELAMHYDSPLDRAAEIAVHIAYLRLLEEKRRAATHALEVAMGYGVFDDEIPF